MADTKLLQLKIDPKTKKQADALFSKIGLDTPTAIRIFLKRAIMHKGIPFDVVYEDKNDCPLCQNLTLNDEAFDEAEEISRDPQKFKTYSSFSEILKDVERE